MPLLFIKFGFFDVLDILIVAFIFYQVYRLVKGTAAINILREYLFFIWRGCWSGRSTWS